MSVAFFNRQIDQYISAFPENVPPKNVPLRWLNALLYLDRSFMVTFPAVIESGSEAKLCASLLKPNESLVMDIYVVHGDQSTLLLQEKAEEEFHRCFNFKVCHQHIIINIFKYVCFIIIHLGFWEGLFVEIVNTGYYFSSGSSGSRRISAENEGRTSRRVFQNDWREKSHVQTLPSILWPLSRLINPSILQDRRVSCQCFKG